MAQAPTTWILTGSPENFAATREHRFRLVGAKERRRNPYPWRFATETAGVLA